MQIDFVITELNVGGAEQALARLACGCVDQGDDVRVFSCGRLPVGSSDPSVDRLTSDRIVAQLEFHGIEITSGEGASWEFPRVYRQLKQWLHRRPGAVCQTMLVHANILGLFAARTRIGAGPAVAGIRVAEAKPGRLWLERQMLSYADHIVCVSQGVQQFAQQQLHIPSSKCSVIPNAVDVQRFAQANAVDWQTFGWPANAEVILFVGRLHAQKNLGLLQQTFDAFAPPGSGRFLCLIGDGPLTTAMQAWADRTSEHRVKVLPWQTDIAPFLAGCRVLVLPSHYEGMPNVVLEAMAAAKPVVVSRVEGIAELVDDGDEQTFQPGNGEQFVRQLNELLGDTSRAQAIGLANQRRMRDHFSISLMVERYRNLYTDLIARHES